MPSCLRLFLHWLRRAASRAAWIAGSKKRDQDADDGDHHQQFDQREASPSAMHRDSSCPIFVCAPYSICPKNC